LKIFFKFAQIFEIFDQSSFSPKAQRITEHCHQKHGVKFSVVLVTVRFLDRWQKSGVKHRVFGKSAELN
jgi:hypothetical protein